MDNRVVSVPVSLLLDCGQTASAKVLWMALRLHPAAGPAELEGLTGLSRHTVLSGAARVTRTQSGPRVKVPGALLADRSVGVYGKLLYGLLQATPGFRGESGQCSYTSLCSLTHFGRNALKRAMGELDGSGWVNIRQKNQRQPIHFRLGTPAQRRSLAEVALDRRRLKRNEYGGEALMQEYLSLLIDSTNFTDNARPGFLLNPYTDERLELDRFYMPDLAFEYHGAQHFRKTEKFSQAQVGAQRFRDVIKAGLCLYADIRLVIVRAEDLSLHGMLQKVGQCKKPLRNLAGHEPLIDMLEEESLKYRASAQ